MSSIEMKRRNGGFTLIEILIAVLIIAVLLSVALPVFGKARENVRLKSCIKNMRNISDAKEQFGMEYRKAVGDVVTMDDLVPGYLRRVPECPSGGEYTIGTIGEEVDCSYEGHDL